MNTELIDDVQSLGDLVATPSVRSLLSNLLNSAETDELAKLQRPAQLQLGDLHEFLKTLLSKLKIDADAIVFYGTQMETYVLVQKSKSLQQLLKDLLSRLCGLTSLKKTESAVRVCDKFLEQARSMSKSTQALQHIERYCTNLEQKLHESLVIFQIRARVKHILHVIEAESPAGECDKPSMIFQKRKRVEPPVAFDIKPKILDWASASTEEREMMQIRKRKLDEIWMKTNEDMRPYETLTKLQKENEELKELISLSTMTPADVERLELENAEKARLIEQLKDALGSLDKSEPKT